MISIVTLTYNNFEELLKTIESLRQVDPDSFEHIIVNGGTCEKTKLFLKSYKGKSISEKDDGIADAFNKGWKISTGSAIMYINSGDTLIDKKYIEYANLNIDTYDYIYAEIIFEDQLCGPMRVRPSKKPLGAGMTYPHNGLVIRKSIFELVGGFNTDYKVCMDYDFLCKMHFLKPKGQSYRNAVVKMDGFGVSTKNQALGLKESKIILKRNKLWTCVNRYLYFKRVVYFSVKEMLFLLGLSNIVKRYKIKKYSR